MTLASASTTGSTSGLLTFLSLSLGVILLAYYLLPYLGHWQRSQNRGRRLKVLEGVPIGRDRYLILAAVGKQVMVLGSSANGVRLVHRLSEAEAAELLAEVQTDAAQENTMPGETAVRASLERMRELLKRGKQPGSWWPF